jgi:hypothetical protein
MMGHNFLILLRFIITYEIVMSDEQNEKTCSFFRVRISSQLAGES